jgi:GH25 family lysozyme M1 (1,4-beta-N-acetylmuramidase)/peptidoglycan hydrolase-like protein with peptidoglycan-binding domain
MRGIDVSNHNNTIDFRKVKNSGIEVIYIKATEGTTYQDPYLERNYNGAVLVGLKVGFYHYLVKTSIPETQAENFYANISNKISNLRVCLDLEENGFNVMDYALRFIKRFEELSNLPIVIYASPYFINDNIDSRLSRYPLWVAHYGVSIPMNNNVWGASYVGHQYSSTGIVDGINGNCDLDNFNDGIFIIENGTDNKSETLLEIGKRYVGSRCIELQKKLIAHGYNCGGYGSDGIFGQETLNSLLQFQKDNGLVADGLAGNLTFAKLNSSKDLIIKELQNQINIQGFGRIAVDGIAGNETLRNSPLLKVGAQGGITKCLQMLLNIYGHNLSLDGIFGENTRNAVIAFQRSNGLSEDGIVGTNTWSKLLHL